jgi:hypothetical protein
MFNLVQRAALGLRNQQRTDRAEGHDPRQDAQHGRQSDRVGQLGEREGRDDGAGFSRRGGDAVRRAADAGGEDFDGDEAT